MPTKPIERLLFAQGGSCFFCRNTLPKAEASVEHLVPLTHGGRDNDENCVACCKGLNNLFGRISLKEKFQIVLNQKGTFVCPAGIATSSPDKTTSAKPIEKGLRTYDDRFGLVVVDLQKRGNARPGNSEKLLNTIKTVLLHQSEPVFEADSIFRDLCARGYVAVCDTKVSYALPPKGE